MYGGNMYGGNMYGGTYGGMYGYGGGSMYGGMYGYGGGYRQLSEEMYGDGPDDVAPGDGGADRTSGPSLLSQRKGRALQGCTDTEGWTNGFNTPCQGYIDQMWCVD